MTQGRGTDSVIEAVGMEAHGSPGAGLAQQMTTFMPDAVAETVMEKAGSDRLTAFSLAIDAVRGGDDLPDRRLRRHGRPLPMLTLFDKQVKLTMGQANVKRWVDDIMPSSPATATLWASSFHTHQLPLDEGPHGYEIFQKKQDNAVKVLLKP